MIEVISPGPLATLQDLGRPGYLELGVGRSGAADQGAHRLANRLVGNPPEAATVEFTMGGLAIRLTRAATIALTGARCPGAATWHGALTLAAGTVLRLGAPATGLRSYLAVRGGFDVAPVLGSRSTDTLSGIGPAILEPGRLLPIGAAAGGDPSDAVVPRPAGEACAVTFGPRADWFAAPEQLLRRDWTVRADSDRVGVRLEGPPLARARHGELPSEPTLPGAIQVPPDGRPIVLFRDAPVTGGYPVIAVLKRAELDRIGQLRPGYRLRLRAG
jgi:biotin-dependent carboxylase-like uncharacterized protein